MPYKLFPQDPIQNVITLQNSGLCLYLYLADHQTDIQQHIVFKHFS